ncbi:hypothetical protein [Prochlorococcus marinus]|uniref:hypothetical protein n=1 Tax=Prochlorococcus marinus TaxID=1219 RepID=UPI0022B47CF8|nr:hypothetical protein [Prochlorococcus marinus]
MKKNSKAFIFRGKTAKSKYRQLIEASTMLAIGINMIIFLNSLPSDFIQNRLSKDTWLQLTSSLISLLESFTLIGGAFIVISLILISLLLIIGALWRFLKLYMNKRSSNIRSNDHTP